MTDERESTKEKEREKKIEYVQDIRETYTHALSLSITDIGD